MDWPEIILLENRAALLRAQAAQRMASLLWRRSLGKQLVLAHAS